MKAVKKATRKRLSDTKVFNWICPNCLEQIYTNGKKMFCESCNIEYDESEEGIKKYCSDFELRELIDAPFHLIDFNDLKHEVSYEN